MLTISYKSGFIHFSFTFCEKIEVQFADGTVKKVRIERAAKILISRKETKL